MVPQLVESPSAARRFERRAGCRLDRPPVEERVEFWAGRLVWRRMLRRLEDAARTTGLDFTYDAKRGLLGVELAVTVTGESSAMVRFLVYSHGLLLVYDLTWAWC